MAAAPSLVTTEDPRRSAAVQEALLARLLSERSTTYAAHLLLIAVVVFLLWGVIPTAELAVWAGCVVLATALRFGIVRHFARTAVAPASVVRAVRLTVTGVGLAWGISAAVVMPEVLMRHVALILVIFSGLVAGGSTTLMPDPVSFRLLTLTMLGPLPFGILANGTERPQWVAVILTGIFAAYMIAVNHRAHDAFVEYLHTNEQLQRKEREASHERARVDSLLASAPVAIAVLDAAQQVRRVNPRFESLFGFPAAEVVGRNLDDLIVPEAMRPSAAELTRRVSHGEILTEQLTRRRRDGRLVPVRTTATLVEGTGDNDLFVMYEDITAEVTARRALEETRDAAQRLAQTRSAFLANMSHEIRTPLNAVLGLTELILDTELTPEQRHSLALVQTSGETLLTLLNDILDFSKIEAEQVQLESITFDLRHLVDSTIGLLGVRARQRRLELLADVASDVPQAVRGDPTRLRQVLTNLVGNAIKFTERGEVVVSLAAAGTRDGRALVRFAVRDTGIGIAPDKLSTIFEEFSQADSSTTRRFGGTGLGLAIARRLVRLMDGDLTVRSEPDRGSEFSFTLPLVHDAPASPAAPPGDTSLAGRRVLVVDDNPTNRRVVRSHLGGLTIEEAEDGVAALEMLRAARAVPFDLVILDAQMPRLDGFGLAAAVRDDPTLAGTKLLLLTSSGQRGDGQRCRELGISAYLTKPAARSDLLDVVRALLGSATAPTGVVTAHSIAEARRGLRILLAEDTPVNQEVAATMLRKRGHTVDIVGTGRAAVDAVAKQAYDVVLMDIQMPEMDGFEATHNIRATSAGRDLPIVALTAHALAGERERCLAKGMSGYLAKPFRAHELFAAVERLANPPAAQPEGQPSRDAPPVDLEGFKAEMREAGAEAAVDDIVATFLETAPPRLATLIAAIAAGDAAEITAAAHALRSACSTIGARNLATLLREIEDGAHAGGAAEASVQRAPLETEAARVFQYLEANRGR